MKKILNFKLLALVVLAFVGSLTFYFVQTPEIQANNHLRTLDKAELMGSSRLHVAQNNSEKEELKVNLLQSSFEKVKPNADEFVTSFYNNLFAMYPVTKPLFQSTEMDRQKGMLLNALAFTINNLTSPNALSETLKGLGSRHVSYGVLPEHYPLVGSALLSTFEEYLKDDWTPELKEAWTDAYDAIVGLMLSGADYSPQAVNLHKWYS